MGKDFNSRNDKGASASSVPVDGPCEASGASKMGFPSFAAPPMDGPVEAGMPTNFNEPATTKPPIDGPDTASAVGQDTNPTY